MTYSWMRLAAASALMLTAGCSEQPTRSAAEFKPAETGRIHTSDPTDSTDEFAASASSEPPFDDLTEPVAGEPVAGEPVGITLVALLFIQKINPCKK